MITTISLVNICRHTLLQILFSPVMRAFKVYLATFKYTIQYY